ncbi:PRKG1 [Symbiodinium sp. CCMP2592]|nr:PRKG1 [Symbiodinium sp. CCMP2592]
MGTTACSVSRRLEGKECPQWGPEDCRAVLEKNVPTDCLRPEKVTQDISSQRLRFLAKVKLFQRLPLEQHGVLASACQVVDFDDEVIIRQGEEGDELFVIQEGEAEVLLGDTPVNLRPGDYFGETALLRDEPRAATVRAKGPLKALSISRQKFVELGLRDKLDFPQRKAVGGGMGNHVEVKEPTPKSDSERQLMANALKKNTNLQSLVDLDRTRINAIIDVAWKQEVPKGTRLITEGDLNADYFYIVQSGLFSISIADQQDGTALGSIGPGGSFGELALIYFAPRAATVEATEKATVWVIDRGNFKKILAKSADELEGEYLKLLDKVELLSPLKKDEKAALARSMTEVSFVKGELIFKQGAEGDAFYLLVDGTVDVIKDGKPKTRLKGTREKAAYFGERALLQKEPRAATLKVYSVKAKALMLDKQSFEMLLGPLEELQRRPKGGKSKLQEQPGSALLRKSRFGKIKRKDLKVLGLLGCGGFGAVELVEHEKTGNTYALKALSKGFVVKSGMQKSVMSERDVQLACDSSFIIKVYETFNSSEHLYFLLECALGGELYATYNKKGLTGKEGHAKFYVAGVVVAFEHLHSKKIVFRDLKPENLLLNDHGHLKLTDMGLAKVVIGKTFTTCGTPDYFAPEMIASKGHTLAVDWWTLGVLGYELMCGNPPFEAEQVMQTYQKIKKGIAQVGFPPRCRGRCEDLIKNLCQKDPSERLPMRSGGTDNIKKHIWYEDFDWQSFESLKMETPYKPEVKSKTDIANFSARDADRPPQVKYKDDGSGWDASFATSE